jgi:hypothetical protein
MGLQHRCDQHALSLTQQCAVLYTVLGIVDQFRYPMFFQVQRMIMSIARCCLRLPRTKSVRDKRRRLQLRATFATRNP